MKKSRLILTLGVLLSTLVLGGCPKQAPIRNIDSAQLASSASASLKDVSGAIRRAGSGLGWQMKDVSPGRILATLYL